MRLSYQTYPCSVGYVLAAVSTEGLVAVTLGKTKDEATIAFYNSLSNEIVSNAGEGTKYDLVAQVAKTIDHPHSKALVDVFRLTTIHLTGTSFQRKVWNAIGEILPGERCTYTDLAKKIGHPKAVRAVASACGANRLAFVIPCHRIVGMNGLGGYRWGADLKKKLLAREAV